VIRRWRARRLRPLLAAAATLAVIGALRSVTARADDTSCERPAITMLRYDEDYSFLRDPSCRTDVTDPLKYPQLDRRLSIYLTLGLDPSSPLAEAHARASEIEERIRRARPDIADVVVHTEP